MFCSCGFQGFYYFKGRRKDVLNIEEINRFIAFDLIRIMGKYRDV
ncbi:hypothetical protein [Clostridium subterminale]